MKIDHTTKTYPMTQRDKVIEYLKAIGYKTIPQVTKDGKPMKHSSLVMSNIDKRTRTGRVITITSRNIIKPAIYHEVNGKIEVIDLPKLSISEFLNKGCEGVFNLYDVKTDDSTIH